MQGINPMNGSPTGVGMSLGGRAAVTDLGLGSSLAQQADETIEQRRQRLMQLMGGGMASMFQAAPYGL